MRETEHAAELRKTGGNRRRPFDNSRQARKHPSNHHGRILGRQGRPRNPGDPTMSGTLAGMAAAATHSLTAPGPLGRNSRTHYARPPRLSDVPLGILFGVLAVLVILSACFSGSETGMMALNRYRLRHLARAGHRGARRASRLLERPDRLIGLILLGNNFVNIAASSLATVLALRLIGEAGVALAAGLAHLGHPDLRRGGAEDARGAAPRARRVPGPRTSFPGCSSSSSRW